MLRPGVVRRRRLGDPRGTPQGASARPASLPRGGGVCPLPAWAPRRRCRAQRGNGKARTARGDPAAHDEQGAGYHISAPPCAPRRAVFREVAQRGRRVAACGWGRLTWTWSAFRGSAGGRPPGGRRAGRRARLRAFQSRPKPRGRSMSRASRSRSHTSARRSAARKPASLGELFAPVLVLGLQGPELGQGGGPPRPLGTSAGPDVAAERGRRRRGARGSGVAVQRR